MKIKAEPIPPKRKAGVRPLPLGGDPMRAPPVVPAVFLGNALAPGLLTAAALRHHAAAPCQWQTEQLVDQILSGDLTETIRPAAVLIALLQTPDGLKVILTRRHAGLSRHAGQIAFPGGRIDPDDASPQAAALREAREEIGLSESAVEILQSLPPLRTGTGYLVTPVVGLVDPDWNLERLMLQASEVVEAFTVPLTYLMDPRHHQLREYAWTDEHAVRHARRFFVVPWDGDHESVSVASSKDQTGSPLIRSASHSDSSNLDTSVSDASSAREPCCDAAQPDSEERRPRYVIWGLSATILRNLYHYLAASRAMPIKSR